jgi:hypothetical protein
LTEEYKIHHIIEGPFHTSDVEDPDGEYEGMDSYFILAKVEYPNGTVYDEEIHFDTFPEYYEVKAWLDKNIEPYIMSEDEWECFDG